MDPNPSREDSEHVSGQRQLLEAGSVSETGGIVIHTPPKGHSYPSHGSEKYFFIRIMRKKLIAKFSFQKSFEK